ncbi:MAG: lysophospholipid acyltransferase family protein [Acidobacteria bacterium]|nr:lysophospholipid acyltransferase family protein [Acidobacteriota bacterium]
MKNWPNLEKVYLSGKRLILAFWHGRIFGATYYFRNRGIVVLTSQNRDGEYIAHVIRRFGYGVARGSSTRGSHRATAEALRALSNGKDVGITMDGPRGPLFVAKRGAAYLAGKSGNPVMPFNVSVEKKWVMKSWDHFQIPKPFSRAVVLIGSPIYVEANATEEEMRAIEAQIQKSLDELRIRGDSWWNSNPDQ